jgi:hypothetical protein
MEHARIKKKRKLEGMLQIQSQDGALVVSSKKTVPLIELAGQLDRCDENSPHRSSRLLLPSIDWAHVGHEQIIEQAIILEKVSEEKTSPHIEQAVQLVSHDGALVEPECIEQALQLQKQEGALVGTGKTSPLIEQDMQLTGEDGALVGTDRAGRTMW